MLDSRERRRGGLVLNTILEVENLKKYFPIQRGVFRKVVGYVKAVDGVSFFIREGETLGLVGESGCGKSTTGHCILRLTTPTEGSVRFRTQAGMQDIAELDARQLKAVRQDIQMIFQDPFSSLDPRMAIRDIIAEPLEVYRMGSRKERYEKVEEMLHKVGLDRYMMERYPYEFSGGQRQRIGIARALILNPRLVVCDEPVSALDVSVQAQILNLLITLQKEMKLTYLFIAHDLSVVEHISDRVMVMYLGKIVEMAASDELYKQPLHPYTEALLSAVSVPDPRAKGRRKPLQGSVPSPANPPAGCNFHTRCFYAKEICRQEEPQLQELNKGSNHYVACHRADELDLMGFEDRVKAQTG